MFGSDVAEVDVEAIDIGHESRTQQRPPCSRVTSIPASSWRTASRRQATAHRRFCQVAKANLRRDAGGNSREHRDAPFQRGTPNIRRDIHREALLQHARANQIPPGPPQRACSGRTFEPRLQSWTGIGQAFPLQMSDAFLSRKAVQAIRHMQTSLPHLLAWVGAW